LEVKMKYIIIAICIALIILAIYIVIKTIRSSLKGDCCNGCAGCSMKNKCSRPEKEE